jgi:hypothetical protein
MRGEVTGLWLPSWSLKPAVQLRAKLVWTYFEPFRNFNMAMVVPLSSKLTSVM